MALFNISDFITWAGQRFTNTDWDSNLQTIVNGFNSTVTGKDISVLTVETNELKGNAKSIDGTLSANSDIYVPSQKAVKTYIDQNVANVVGIDKQAIINGNFDDWSYGSPFTNPINDYPFAIGEWRVFKANGSGSSPSVNLTQENTVPDDKSVYSAGLNVTALGSVGAGRYWHAQQSILTPNFEKFKNRIVSYGVKILAPVGSWHAIELDDGVNVHTQTFTGTGAFVQRSIANVLISASATKLDCRIVLADSTNTSSIGLHYISQVQFNAGSNLNIYNPNLLEYERALGIARLLPLDTSCSDLIVNSATTASGAPYTFINTTYTKKSTDKLLRITTSGSNQVNSANSYIYAQVNAITVHYNMLHTSIPIANASGSNSLTTYYDISGIANGSSIALVVVCTYLSSGSISAQIAVNKSGW